MLLPLSGSSALFKLGISFSLKANSFSGAKSMLLFVFLFSLFIFKPIFLKALPTLSLPPIEVDNFFSANLFLKSLDCVSISLFIKLFIVFLESTVVFLLIKLLTLSVVTFLSHSCIIFCIFSFFNFNFMFPLCKYCFTSG